MNDVFALEIHASQDVQQLELFPRSRPRNKTPNIAPSIENYKLALGITVQKIFQKMPDYSKKDSFSCYMQ